MKKPKNALLNEVLGDALRWIIAAAVSVAVIFASLGLRSLSGDLMYTQKPAEGEQEASADGSISYKHVDAPTPSRENGVITADEWAEIYPEIVASYKMMGENTYTVDYLEQDPYLVTIYAGYGFAKEYNAARGHNYCLEEVYAIARPHPYSNCLTCKTADFTAMVNAQGAQAYALDFQAAFEQCSENVGCYTCHENQAGDAGKLVVTHDYINTRLADEMASIAPAVLSCGQCHIEYYFMPDETHATTVPYTTVAEMSPDAILAYYNEIGFADWTQEATGAKLLKAQHPEMETFLAEGSYHNGFGMTCASCHMEVVTTAEGYTYTSHNFVSPLESEAILKNVCATCHGTTDMAEKVHTLQATITARETEVGNALADLNQKLAEAVQSGNYTEEQLDQIRDLYRSAQWYFDFDYVENSEGAHNSRLANYCLDTAESYIKKALELF